MSEDTGVTVLLTDGSEEHFEDAAKWSSTGDGGVLLISHEPDGENQRIIAEYLPGRAVRVCHGPPFRVPSEPEGNAGPEDGVAAVYESGFKAGVQSVQEVPVAADRAETPERPWEKVGGAPSGAAIAPEPERAGPEDDAPAVEVPQEA